MTYMLIYESRMGWGAFKRLAVPARTGVSVYKLFSFSRRPRLLVNYLQNILFQIADATTNKQYNFAVDDLCDIIELAGCSMLTLKMSRKQELVDAIVHFVMVDRVQKALKQ